MLKPRCEKQHLNRSFLSLIIPIKLIDLATKFCTATTAILKGIWKWEKRQLQLLLRHGSDVFYSCSAFYTSTKTSYKKAFNTAGAPLPPQANAQHFHTLTLIYRLRNC